MIHPRYPFLFAALVLSCCVAAFADEIPKVEPLPPEIAPASDEGQEAIRGFGMAEDLRVKLFAAEPMLANPVAFYVDHLGRVYVCETFRQKKGVEDNRDHADWVDDDLAAQTVEDRLAYFKKHLGERLQQYAQHEDRIRLLEDTDGDGIADRSSVFADHFNGVLDGTGAGVLAHDGRVYYTCIPNLYLLRDTDGDDKADAREVLHTGYGVRVAYRGHDMHGLCVGPDGKLYFSIGDRGLNVTTADRHLVNPASGAVLRCNLDGSNLEMIAIGFRNPQELAFDDYGNLFTGDNNSDSGDEARWVYVVEGGDSGWRMAFQYLADRGPFNRENLWHPYHEDQPAYIVPPVANLTSGPSGLTYYPGTGLSARYQGRFFLCDFRGAPAGSAIHSFRAKAKGAFFELVDHELTIENVLATDVDFGPDGGLYVSDWVIGWNGEGKGRIYRFFDPDKVDDPLVLEVKRLLADGVSKRSADELAKLLAHADRRVRQAAQFALVNKTESAALEQAARSHENLLARLHAIWGLGQLGRRGGELRSVYDVALELLDDSNAEVRAQAAKLLGDGRVDAAFDKLIDRLQDDSLRVRQFAAMSLGKLHRVQAIEPLLEMLAENADQDPIVRHGGIMGLAGTMDIPALLEAAATHKSASARMGILVALRKLQSPEVAFFVDDVDERLVVEAARAIHDVPIREAMPQLATLITRSSTSESLWRRVLNANYRLGAQENANAVAAFAARDDVPESMRLEALEMLAAWQSPSHRDRVLGMWRPLTKRDEQIAAVALSESFADIISGPSAVRARAATVGAQLGLLEAVPALRDLFADQSQPGDVRAAALRSLATLKDDQLDTSVESALSDSEALVRAAGRRALVKLRPEEAIKSLEDAIYQGEVVERQDALAMLSDMIGPAADKVISAALDNLIAGQMPADTQLDVLQAAENRSSSKIQTQLAKYDAARPQDDPLADYHESLAGGNAKRGRKIFFERSEVSCVRCHKIDRTGGDVGPDLSKIGADKNRDYLLESIVLPNQTIAKNFETLMVATDDGQILSGIVKEEDDQQIRLMTADAKLITVDKESIEDRRAGKSAMPEDLIKHLTKSDLRDLVEFLSSLKTAAPEFE